MDSHILSAPDLPRTGLQPSSSAEPHEHEIGSDLASETSEAAHQLQGREQDQIPGYEDEPLVQGPVYRTTLAPAAEPTVHAPQAQDRIRLSEDKPTVATPEMAAPVTRASAPELTMPDEPEPDAAPAAVPPVPATPTAQHSTRTVLLGTAGALGLTVLLAGGGFYALTHQGRTLVPAATVANTVAIPQAIRPSEALAANQAGLQATGTPKTQPAGQTHKADAADILGLKSGVPMDASPLASAAAPEAAAPPKPAAIPEAPAADKPAGSATAATSPLAPTQPAPAPTPTPAPTPVTHPADAADTAAALVPAPMSSQQMVDVLAVVTEVGTLVRDMRNENAQLRTQVATLNDTLASKTMDFEQRLSLAEARGSVAAAMGAGKPQAAAPAGVIPAVVTVSGAHTLRAMAMTPVPAPARSARDYRVQAASPGLAVLADAGAGPGRAEGLQVSVGDDVPGVGRITSIGQRGSTWVVQTDHGAIQ